jgi:hypothetical protein
MTLGFVFEMKLLNMGFFKGMCWNGWMWNFAFLWLLWNVYGVKYPNFSNVLMY